MLLYLLQVQIAPVTPVPPSLEQQQWLRAGWVRRELFRACQGGFGGAHPGSFGARCPLPCPTAQPNRALPRTRFPRPTPCVNFPGAPGSFPRVLFARRIRRQLQAKIYFYGRSLWDDLGPVFSHIPSGQRPGDGLASGCRHRGKRPRKETFPSLIVLPLAERVMKILGKCYTTRGYPFGAKRPEKPGRFPGGEGRCWGRRYLPGSTSASSAALPPFPGHRNLSPKII